MFALPGMHMGRLLCSIYTYAYYMYIYYIICITKFRCQYICIGYITGWPDIISCSEIFLDPPQCCHLQYFHTCLSSVRILFSILGFGKLFQYFCTNFTTLGKPISEENVPYEYDDHFWLFVTGKIHPQVGVDPTQRWGVSRIHPHLVADLKNRATGGGYTDTKQVLRVSPL
jgi:hypothetical protein